MLEKKQYKEFHCFGFFDNILCFRATLFAKSKNPMLSHLYADVVEEEGASKGGGKKKGGSMQTISATHRVSIYLTLKLISKSNRIAFNQNSFCVT